MLYIKNTAEKGRGVFSDKPIKKGEMIENSPVIIIPKEQKDFFDKTVVSQYWLNWKDGCGAFALGLVMMYNHSDDNNAEYLNLLSENSVIINAVRDINAHEEICTNYGNENKFSFIKK